MGDRTYRERAVLPGTNLGAFLIGEEAVGNPGVIAELAGQSPEGGGARVAVVAPQPLVAGRWQRGPGVRHA
ncbi:hypothetical protein GCM10023205_04000 [Yinghuangia aomiensis]|uniref:Uncharacterized protein n=1 Tax=Yinghuangia aomiensis TaxID=676205 RepID=A0ABP9GTF1_9ACTN